jgi:hypothetical protein
LAEKCIAGQFGLVSVGTMRVSAYTPTSRSVAPRRACRISGWKSARCGRQQNLQAYELLLENVQINRSNAGRRGD